jgi:hypothetical protein
MLILSYITGREWDYVMISLVRTLPSNKIEKNPDTDWIQRHVGEMSDINQINPEHIIYKNGELGISCNIVMSKRVLYGGTKLYGQGENLLFFIIIFF